MGSEETTGAEQVVERGFGKRYVGHRPGSYGPELRPGEPGFFRVHSGTANRAEPVGFTVMPLSEDSRAVASCCLAEGRKLRHFGPAGVDEAEAAAPAPRWPNWMTRTGPGPGTHRPSARSGRSDRNDVGNRRSGPRPAERAESITDQLRVFVPGLNCRVRDRPKVANRSRQTKPRTGRCHPVARDQACRRPGWCAGVAPAVSPRSPATSDA